MGQRHGIGAVGKTSYGWGISAWGESGTTHGQALINGVPAGSGPDPEWVSPLLSSHLLPEDRATLASTLSPLSRTEGHTCPGWPSSALVSPGTEQLQVRQWQCHTPPRPALGTIPRTCRWALQRRVSAVKVTVPESSSASLSSVRLCPQPVALIRHVLLGFTRMPSRVQTPLTPG